MRILHLTLKKKWFDMILSGKKTEEYREVKPYWIKRLSSKSYDAIHFRNGYSAGSPAFTIELLDISRSLGIVEWGAPEGEVVYMLKLGKILENNPTQSV